MSSVPDTSYDAISALEACIQVEIEGQAQLQQNRREFVQLYIECAATILTTMKRETIAGCKMRLLNIATAVIERAELYKTSLGGAVKMNNPIISAKLLLTECAYYCFQRAIFYDEKQKFDVALPSYLQASELLLKVYKYDPDNVNIKKQLVDILDRAEALKKFLAQSKTSAASVISQPSKGTPVKEKISKQEIEVLKTTSKINGKVYLPFIESADVQDSFFYSAEPFVDPDGYLPLSTQQQEKFFTWKRPVDLFTAPKMTSMVSAFSVTQSLVTDCSFVASLCVAANYEKKYGKPLITKAIFPQDKNGKPIYNPSGKYMIKLYFNGIARKVIIDDYLPVGKEDEFLCCHTTNRNELWVSLLEKAYMKLNGGYQFPGSNSGIDLHSLTGWIPEDVYIDDKNFSKDKMWTRLLDGYALGACLITVSTGQLTPQLQEQLGLHPMHAYAVLDVREVRGHRLLQIKNPWTHKRWRGKFSPDDKKSWTRELLDELNYDLIGALQYDNGVFWIDYASLCGYFAVIHLSWNPDLFSHVSAVHDHWKENQKPMLGRDSYSFDNNPQYCLEMQGKGSAWIMLTRHVTNIDSRNDQFLTLHAYPSGKRIYYRGGNQPQPLIEGVYSNNPLYRVCLNNEENKANKFSLVLSQHEFIKSSTYTLRIYSSVPCSLKPIPALSQYVQTVHGSWTAQSAGGSCNNVATYKLNPQYLVRVPPGATSLIFKLETNNEKYHVNVMVCNTMGARVIQAATNIVLVSSGNYRNSFCVCYYNSEASQSEKLYTVVLSTFQHGQTGPFTFTVESSLVPITVQQL